MKTFFSFIPAVFLPALLFLSGAYFLCRLCRYFLPGRLFPALRRGARTGAGALSLALAGTLGVGNIVGVAGALSAGGPGALFWMVVAAFLAMPLKYAEVTLGMAHRTADAAGRFHGGAPYYIRSVFRGRTGRVLSAFFALLMFAAMLTLGGVVQSHAAAEGLFRVFGWPPALTGALLALAVLLVLWRGGGKPERVTAWLIPFLCVLYVAVTVFLLWRRREALPAALSAVFSGAFSGRSATAGILGFLWSGAVRYGVSRGLVSNEAGCGSTPTAHATAGGVEPAWQGLLGIAEVFVDTVLLCSLTGLALLVGGGAPTAGSDGMAWVLSAYGSALGPLAGPFISLSVLAFAFATLLCFSHYGTESVYFLSGGRKKGAGFVFPALVCSVFAGALLSPAPLWALTDVILALMTFLNLTALFFARKEIGALSADFFIREEGKGGRERKRKNAA